jgi:hypothetical protein
MINQQPWDHTEFWIQKTDESSGIRIRDGRYPLQLNTNAIKLYDNSNGTKLRIKDAGVYVSDNTIYMDSSDYAINSYGEIFCNKFDSIFASTNKPIEFFHTVHFTQVCTFEEKPVFKKGVVVDEIYLNFIYGENVLVGTEINDLTIRVNTDNLTNEIFSSDVIDIISNSGVTRMRERLFVYDSDNRNIGLNFYYDSVNGISVLESADYTSKSLKLIGKEKFKWSTLKPFKQSADSITFDLTGGRIDFGVLDPFGRYTIWTRQTNSQIRLGSLTADGDPTNISSEGFTVIGKNAQGDDMSGTEYGYMRLKPTRIGLYSGKDQVYTGYMFKVDVATNEFYLKDNAGVTAFSVDRVNKTTTSESFITDTIKEKTTNGNITLQNVGTGGIKIVSTVGLMTDIIQESTTNSDLELKINGTGKIKLTGNLNVSSLATAYQIPFQNSTNTYLTSASTFSYNSPVLTVGNFTFNGSTNTINTTSGDINIVGTGDVYITETVNIVDTTDSSKYVQVKIDTANTRGIVSPSATNYYLQLVGGDGTYGSMSSIILGGTGTGSVNVIQCEATQFNFGSLGVASDFMSMGASQITMRKPLKFNNSQTIGTDAGTLTIQPYSTLIINSPSQITGTVNTGTIKTDGWLALDSSNNLIRGTPTVGSVTAPLNLSVTNTGTVDILTCANASITTGNTLNFKIGLDISGTGTQKHAFVDYYYNGTAADRYAGFGFQNDTDSNLIKVFATHVDTNNLKLSTSLTDPTAYDILTAEVSGLTNGNGAFFFIGKSVGRSINQYCGSVEYNMDATDGNYVTLGLIEGASYSNSIKLFSTYTSAKTIQTSGDFYYSALPSSGSGTDLVVSTSSGTLGYQIMRKSASSKNKEIIGNSDKIDFYSNIDLIQPKIYNQKGRKNDEVGIFSEDLSKVESWNKAIIKNTEQYPDAINNDVLICGLIECVKNLKKELNSFKRRSGNIKEEIKAEKDIKNDNNNFIKKEMDQTPKMDNIIYTNVVENSFIMNEIFGNGEDKTETIKVTSKIFKDTYYEDLIIEKDCELITNNFRIFVKNTLIINGTISNDGENGDEYSIGKKECRGGKYTDNCVMTGTLMSGESGGNGVVGNGKKGFNSDFALCITNGGNGSDSKVFKGGLRGISKKIEKKFGSEQCINYWHNFINCQDHFQHFISAGCGGGSGAGDGIPGAGGGSGGGNILICAKRIVFGKNGTISAKGGNGGNGKIDGSKISGAGGGGSGGNILIMTTNIEGYPNLVVCGGICGKNGFTAEDGESGFVKIKKI